MNRAPIPTIALYCCRVALREGVPPQRAVRLALREIRPLAGAPYLGATSRYRGRYDVAVLCRYLQLHRARERREGGR